jgi:uncharacterized protein (DUF1778 family)
LTKVFLGGIIALNVVEREANMACIGVRMTEDEKQWVDAYARAHRQSVSDFVRSVLFEKMDNELELKLFEEYLSAPSEDKETISLAEAKSMWST